MNDIEPESISLGIPSSGDKAADLAALERFAKNDVFIQAGMCPNGHGEMFKASERMSECTECGFTYLTVQIAA